MSRSRFYRALFDRRLVLPGLRAQTAVAMTWIKICGITNLEDARSAVAAGADALGFVFYEKSPRNVTPEAVANIVAELAPTIEMVGVCAGRAVAEWREIARGSKLTSLQFHLRFEAADYLEQWRSFCSLARSSPEKRYLAIPFALVEDPPSDRSAKLWDLGSGDHSGCDAFFLDSGTVDRPGGTGKAFDWARAAHWVESAQRKTKVVVSGGLRPSNVAQAIRILKPWGVDVASGVEQAPGRKDPQKIRAFIAAVRQVETSL